MSAGPDNDVTRAERIGRARARLFPLAGIAIIVVNALASGPEPGVLGGAAWLALFAVCFALAVTGGVVGRRLRGITDDEGTRADRAGAIFTGYCATVACVAGLYVVSLFEPLSARQALQIVLATAVASPLIGFGARERRALG